MIISRVIKIPFYLFPLLEREGIRNFNNGRNKKLLLIILIIGDCFYLLLYFILSFIIFYFNLCMAHSKEKAKYNKSIFSIKKL